MKKWIKLTQEKQIILEVKKFRNLLKNSIKKLKFGLVVEPGMRFMHYNILSPNFLNLMKKRISQKNNFI